jgi:hypothetical protein
MRLTIALAVLLAGPCSVLADEPDENGMSAGAYAVCGAKNAHAYWEGPKRARPEEAEHDAAEHNRKYKDEEHKGGNGTVVRRFKR